MENIKFILVTMATEFIFLTFFLLLLIGLDQAVILVYYMTH